MRRGKSYTSYDRIYADELDFLTFLISMELYTFVW